jgi:hypothetical protein
MYKFVTIFFLFFLPTFLSAQNRIKNEVKKIRVSGIILSESTNTPIPFAAIYIKNSLNRTVADSDGFFSIMAQPNDTIIMSELGFDTYFFIVPKDTTEVSTIERLRATGIPNIAEQPEEKIDDLHLYNFERLGREFGDNIFIRSIEQQRRLRTIFKEQYQREWIYYNYGYVHPRIYRLEPLITRPNNFINPYNWVLFKQDWEMGKFNDPDVHLDMHDWIWRGSY